MICKVCGLEMVVSSIVSTTDNKRRVTWICGHNHSVEDVYDVSWNIDVYPLGLERKVWMGGESYHTTV